MTASVKPDYAMPRLKEGYECADCYFCKKFLAA